MFGGSVLVVITLVAVYFGLAERILDKMNMTDRTAILWLAALLLGSYINFTLVGPPNQLVVNVGGGIVPLLLAGFIIARADEPLERVRALSGIIITGAIIYGLIKVVPDEHAGQVVSYVYIFAAIAAVVGYLAGRSRRAAFVSGLMGVWLGDLIHFAEVTVRGIPGRTWIGGAGAFDSIIIAGLGAVIIAEVVGEIRERAVRTGPGREEE